ncbi:MAG: hypothetical protein EP335_14225 [Alphaproteobacteria bacterium]|nr:MAG: hypothetical protein EP335_14225 [Alphaproteobacteria bacterium]
MSVRIVLLALVSLAVAACSRNPLEVVVSNCPAVAVVGDAGTLTRFRGDGRTTDDVAFTASIMNVQSSCVEDVNVVSSVSFDIGGQAGRALASREVTLPYFVVVLKDNSRIVSKKQYDVTLRFDSNGFARASQSLEQVIPTIEQARRYNYEVLIGFQLSPEDVAYNMER